MLFIKNLGSLTIGELIDVKTSKRVYKSLNPLIPYYLGNIFSKGIWNYYPSAMEIDDRPYITITVIIDWSEIVCLQRDWSLEWPRYSCQNVLITLPFQKENIKPNSDSSRFAFFFVTDSWNYDYFSYSVIISSCSL